MDTTNARKALGASTSSPGTNLTIGGIESALAQYQGGSELTTESTINEMLDAIKFSFNEEKVLRDLCDRGMIAILGDVMCARHHFSSMISNWILDNHFKREEAIKGLYEKIHNNGFDWIDSIISQNVWKYTQTHNGPQFSYDGCAELKPEIIPSNIDHDISLPKLRALYSMLFTPGSATRSTIMKGFETHIKNSSRKLAGIKTDFKTSDKSDDMTHWLGTLDSLEFGEEAEAIKKTLMEYVILMQQKTELSKLGNVSQRLRDQRKAHLKNISDTKSEITQQGEYFSDDVVSFLQRINAMLNGNNVVGQQPQQGLIERQGEN